MTARSGLTPVSSWAPPRATRKPVITSSNTSRAPVAVARSRSSSRNPSAGGTRPMFAAYGSQMIAANSCVSVGRANRVGVVPRHDHGVRRRGRRDARAGRERLGREPAARLGEQAVDVAVVGARELEELLAPGRPRGRGGGRSSSPRCPTTSCAASRRAGIRRATSSARSTSAIVGAPNDVPRCAASTTAASDIRVGVAVDERAPRADPVDVAVAVDVDDLRTARALDEDRGAPDRAHRAHGRVHAAGQARDARA